MTRHEIRVNVFKLVFRYSFHNAEQMKEQIADYEEDLISDNLLVDEAVLSEIQKKAEAVCEKIPELDMAIEEASEGWKLNRMNKVDLSILRLALYEMRYDENIPLAVAIDEAVELAKEFGGDSSPKFVNGVLAKMKEARKEQKESGD